ncbi:DNA-binding response regulator [Cohnella soli]|uniref:DNA-binding response regulator n=1 Tax=Cohnella soli TaxID=425005 RepID=A0ABW0HZ18_9BACL
MGDILTMHADMRSSYDEWMAGLLTLSSGERKRKLLRDRPHAETAFLIHVWWPTFGHFNHLEAEFEIRDFKDGWRYLDFAYITEGFKICIEIDGFGPHARNINRTQFADQLMRQNHLVIDGWIVIRFSYDDIIERPRFCQQIIQQLFGKLGIMGSHALPSLTPLQSAIIRLAASLPVPLKPQDAAAQLNVHRITIARNIQPLVQMGLLIPTRSDVKRVCSYRINKAALPKSLQ